MKVALVGLGLTVLLTVVLTGCLRKVSGTYKDATNSVPLEFHGDGKVYAKIFGVPVVGSYEEKDGKIIFKGAEGDVFIDIVDAEILSMSHPLSPLTGELQLKRQR